MYLFLPSSFVLYVDFSVSGKDKLVGEKSALETDPHDIDPSFITKKWSFPKTVVEQSGIHTEKK